jgi:hypothetical protein
MRPLRLATGTIAIVLLAWARPAAAQDVLVQGPGVRVGEATVLRPRVGVEAGFVSNIYYTHEEPVGAPVLRLMAGLDVTPAGADRQGSDRETSPAIDFRAGAEIVHNEYLSSDASVRAQRDVDANLLAQVVFNPRGAIALDVGDRFTRTTRPAEFEDTGLGRNRNHFRTEVRWQPGGRLITAGLRYENIVDVFDSGEDVFADRMLQVVGLKGNWKFFPYSQVWLDTSVGFNGKIGEASDFKNGSNPLRITAGIDTVLTEPTTLNAYAGYANGFYADGPSYNIIVGGAKLGWRYMPVGRLSLGYAYEVTDSVTANYYGEHHISLTIAQQLRRVYLTGGTGVRFRGYRGVPMALGPADRDDFIFELGARAEYLLRSRFSFYVDAGVTSVSTEFRGVSGGDPSYLRGEVVAGAVAAF